MKTAKNEELDPRIREALEALKPVPPRDPRKAAVGRAAFLAEAERLKKASAGPISSFGAVSLGPWARLKGWIREKFIPHPTKEVFAMPNLLVAVMAIVAMVFGGGAVTVKAADSATPGSLLYPVDLAVEDLRLSLAPSPEEQAQLHLAFAQERLEEIQTMLQAGQAEGLATAVENLDEHLAMAAQLAAQMAQQGQMAQARETAQAMAQQAEALQRAMGLAPEPARQALQQAYQHAVMAWQQTQARLAGARDFRLTGSVEALGEDTLTVAGVTVQIAPNTRISGSVEVGSTVHVEGLIDPASGQWVAVKVSVVAPNAQGQGPAQIVVFKGTVDSVEEGQIVVSGQVILLTDSTRIRGDLAEGVEVEVKAQPNADGTLTALSVQVRPGASGQGQGGSHRGQPPTMPPIPSGTPQGQAYKVEFVGIVESMDGEQWTVNGQILQITDETEIQGQVTVGSLIKVKALVQDDGSLTAIHVKVMATPGFGGGHDGSGSGSGGGHHDGGSGSNPTPTPTPNGDGSGGSGSNDGGCDCGGMPGGHDGGH